MNLKWHEVTWYSKLLSILFFLCIFPILVFYIGDQYGEVNQMISDSLAPMIMIRKVVIDSSKDRPAEPLLAYRDATIDAALAECQGATSTNEGAVQCISRSVASYQALAETEYARIGALLDADIARTKTASSTTNESKFYVEEKDHLAKADQAWESYTKESCSAERDEWTFGVGAPLAEVSCQVDLAQIRVQDLKSFRAATSS